MKSISEKKSEIMFDEDKQSSVATSQNEEIEHDVSFITLWNSKGRCHIFRVWLLKGINIPVGCKLTGTTALEFVFGF